MAEKRFDCVVIGAGPGGYVAAIRLGQLGKKTAVVERERVGGICLNWGCIPSKALIHAAGVYDEIARAAEIGIAAKGVALDYAKTQSWKDGVVKRLTDGIGQLLKANGVEILSGTAGFRSPTQIEVTGSGGKDLVTAGAFVVATGGKPFEVPGFPFDGKTVVTSKEALSWTQVPESLVVIGGGVIGLELGTVYAKLGTKVTVVEMMDQLLPGTDPDLVKVVARGLKKKGVDVFLKAKALGIKKEKGKTAVEIEWEGKKQAIPCEKVLVAVGVRPNTEGLGLEKAGVRLTPKGFIQVNDRLQSSVPTIYAIGDVAGPPLLAHKASKEGVVAAEIIAGKEKRYDVRAIPGVIFTDPEIATVGLTEAQAKAAGYEVQTGSFPYTASGRGLSVGKNEGLVKIVGDGKTGRLLGLHVCGATASDMVAEGALAIEMGAAVEDLALTVHPHPTFSEGVMEAAEAALGHAIHVINKPIAAAKG